MDGLERMDKPRRWPMVLGLTGFVAIVAVLAWVFRPAATPAPATPGATVPAAVEGGAVSPAAPGDEAPADQPALEASHSEVPAPAAPVTPPGAEVQPADSNAPVATADAAAPTPQPVTQDLLAEAEALMAADKKDKARESYLAALAGEADAARRDRIEAALGALNVELIRFPWPMSEKHEVVVAEGDSIKAIARKFGTTVELIVKGNHLKRPDVIRPGQRLKVFGGKMEIRVSKGRRDLLLTSDGRFFKRYVVGTGKYEKTPVGTFTITDRILEPPWWREDGKVIPFGDTENILGTRWMAIKAAGDTPPVDGYGIHGTWDTNSIGKAESAGCIRLRNEDVEELFELVPVGTPVTIEE
jgi:lipoprotein-anchoring transpeptidase ErfK/SrfK